MWGLGIDFGTTHTAAAMCDADGAVKRLATATGSLAIPSSVFADGKVLWAGNEADNMVEYRLDAYEPTPKRCVGMGPVPLGDYEFEPSALIGAVLSAVIDGALDQHNRQAPASVVLTHPAEWETSGQRQVLSDALALAADGLGTALPEPVFVSEPVAAAHWFAQTDPVAEGQHFAVYDLGGGTFDAAVLRQAGDTFTVVQSGGMEVGGFDFDNLLFNYLGHNHIAPANPQLWAALSAVVPDDQAIAEKRRKMLGRVRDVKHRLSAQNQARTLLPGLSGQVQITRDEYNRLISAPVQQTVAQLAATIERAGVDYAQIAAIYRIGAAARTPLVATELDRLHLPIRVQEHPKLVVAEGAAVIAHRALNANTVAPSGRRTADAEPMTVADEEPISGDQDRRGGDGAIGTRARVRGLGHNLQKKFREAQHKVSQSRVSYEGDLQARLMQAGIDARHAYRSRLGLRAAQPDLRRVMTIQTANLGARGQFDIDVERRRFSPTDVNAKNFKAYVAEMQQAWRRDGWYLWPPQTASTVANSPGGMEQWATRQLPDREPERMLHGLVQRGPYMVRVSLAEALVSLRQRVHVDTLRAGAALSTRLASSVNVVIVVDGVAHERVGEKIVASATIGGKAAEITAELLPVGADSASFTDSLKTAMAARTGKSLILMDGEKDVFFGDNPCSAYRFELWPDDTAVAAGQPRQPISHWVWIGTIEERVAAITVESPDLGAPWYTLRDLVALK